MTTRRLLHGAVLLVACGSAVAGAAQATSVRIQPPLLAYAQPSSTMARNGIVYLARPDGSRRRRFGVGSNPLLSSDGTQIAFVHVAPRAQTLVLGTVASGQRRSLPLPHLASLLGWVGHRLLISTGSGLYLSGQTGSGWVQIVPGTIGMDETPVAASVSPSGADIAVLGSSATGENLYVVHVADGHLRPLVTDNHVLGVAWGRRGIAYTDGFPQGEIWLIQPDSSGRRQLTHAHAGFEPVAFDAAGAHLLAENPAMHNGRLWAVDVRTGRARPLTPWTGDLFGQGVSRDGRTVFAGVGCGGVPGWYGHLETIPFDGGPPHVFAKGACRGSWIT